MANNECKICSSVRWDAGTTKDRYTLKCLKTCRIIEENIHPNTPLACPTWCPKHANEVGNKPFMSAFDRWHSKIPNLTLKDIKEGQKYHIPPVNGDKRKDIIIERVYDDHFSYREYGKTYIDYMYPSFMAFKYLVIIK